MNNKQENEIKAEIVVLERYTKETKDRLESLHQRLAEAEKLEKLDKLLEKPKLRHGDYGITTRESIDEYDKFLIRKTPKGELEPEYQDGYTDGSTYAKKNFDDYTIFGNVFDLMKDWSEPFVDYEKKCKGGNTLMISQSSWVSDGIEFRINGGCYVTASIPEAEEIWHKLGHAIADLKRKKGISE